jgi:PIN domain nuclease of toxin-antitoxin system
MNRDNAYYLDTNIIIYTLFERHNLDCNVSGILVDSVNFLYVSYVAVKEVIHLLKQERIKLLKPQKNKTLLELLNEAGIIIKPVTVEHLKMYETLEYTSDHNDPNDMLIIAQSISDRIPVISSDRKFKYYENQGLKFVFNKR